MRSIKIIILLSVAFLLVGAAVHSTSRMPTVLGLSQLLAVR